MIFFNSAVSVLVVSSALTTFTASLLMPELALAEKKRVDDPICRLKTGITEEHILGTNLGYFAQPQGQHRIMFMGAPEADGARYPGKTKTHVYDLRTRTTKHATTDLDPYPTPDGEFYVHPNPLEFFESSDIDRKGDSAKPVGSFNDHLGWYESVGQFPDPKDGVPTYRVITATTDSAMKLGSVRDYRPSVDATQPGVRRIVAVQAKPVPVCNNVPADISLALPILSRDGKRLSVFNGKTGTTQILRLNMPSGQCEIEFDLGGASGKGAFSFDGKYFAATIAFGDPSRATVVVLDLRKPGAPLILPLPPRTGLSATSVTFLPNGDLLVTGNEQVQGDKNLLFRLPGNSFQRETTALQKTVAGFLVQHCPQELAGTDATLIAPFIDRATCVEVARKSKASVQLDSCQSIPAMSRPTTRTKTTR